jgi:hypothetical protein
MHYVRLLRRPRVATMGRNEHVLSVLLTITTDLGDTFLYPDEPVTLGCTLRSSGDEVSHVLRTLPTKGLPSRVPSPIIWKSGMRVLEITLAFDESAWNDGAKLVISALEGQSGLLNLSATKDVLPWHREQQGKAHCGMIAEVAVEFRDGHFSDVSLRDYALDLNPEGTPRLVIEEDIGESIARHVWDAGLVTAAFMADTCRNTSEKHHIQNLMPITRDTLSVLELGCGVGILGISIATCIGKAAESQGVKLSQPLVLLTDLAEAEERASSNIARCKKQNADYHILGSDVRYETLDWDDGARGSFGPIVRSRAWDFIVLSDCTYNVDAFPSLVGTLTALHSLNTKSIETEPQERTATRVILSTKPRHESEKELFALLATDEWQHRLLVTIPLPRIDGEDEAVEIYLLEKVKALGQEKRKRMSTEDLGTSRPKRVVVADPAE